MLSQLTAGNREGPPASGASARIYFGGWTRKRLPPGGFCKGKPQFCCVTWTKTPESRSAYTVSSILILAGRRLSGKEIIASGSIKRHENLPPPLCDHPNCAAIPEQLWRYVRTGTNTSPEEKGLSGIPPAAGR